jgi:hypothetical protein
VRLGNGESWCSGGGFPRIGLRSPILVALRTLGVVWHGTMDECYDRSNELCECESLEGLTWRLCGEIRGAQAQHTDTCGEVNEMK